MFIETDCINTSSPVGAECHIPLLTELRMIFSRFL